MKRQPTRLVDRVRTPATVFDTATALVEGYRLALRAHPFTNEIAVALAQLTQEHGLLPDTVKDLKGGKTLKSVWNNNLGNRTCYPDADCDKFALTTKERTKKVNADGTSHPDDVWREMTLYYVAYPTLISSAGSYWRKVSSKFPESFKLFAGGDAHEIAVKLSQENYYTGPSEDYERTLAYYVPRYYRLLATGSEKL